MSGPWTNQVVSQVVVGQTGSPQIIIAEVDGTGEIQFLVPAIPLETPGNFAGGSGGSSQATLLMSGPQHTADGIGANDWVQIVMFSDSDTAVSAAGQINFIDSSGGQHEVAEWDASGFNIKVGALISPNPSVPVNTASGPTPETWHKATLINGWSASGGVAGVWYRFLALGDGLIEVIGDVINTTATGNSVCATLPSGWRSGINSNHPAGVNTGGTARATPWIAVDTSGDIQITGIVTANLETFFHIFIPADLTA